MLTVILLTTVFVVLLALFYQKHYKLPPGPFPIPIFGNLLQINRLSAKHGGIVGALKEFQKEYGDVFTLWMGPLPTVHVCTTELANETMIKRGHEFIDRWFPNLFFAVTKGRGLVHANGPAWQEQRRFSMHILRNFGMGRGIQEERIMMEFNYRTGLIDKEIEEGNDEFDAGKLFELTVGSIINRMLFNERLDTKVEEEFFYLKRRLDETIHSFSFMDVLYGTPLLDKIPWLMKRWQPMMDTLTDVREFVKRQIKVRLDAVKNGEHVITEPDDYVDAYIVKMKEEEGLPETSFSEDILVTNCMDLWQAGQDSTSVSQIYSIFLLLQHPDVMKKTLEELLSVTKGERHLSLKDKPNTPYFNAVLTELLRVSSIVAVNGFRWISQDTVVGDYVIPPNVAVNAEISVIMSNDKIFEDPEKFDPNRYLDGQERERHVPAFGHGKRLCIGESLARAELFLITGNLLLRYEISLPEEKDHKPDHTRWFLDAPQYKMKLKKRVFSAEQ